MLDKKIIKRKPKGKWVLPSLIHAAKLNDFEEAEAALEENPECIHEKNNYEMNALQIAMLNFHTEMGLFLLNARNVNNEQISTITKDSLGRDSMDIALLCSNNELGDAIWERWNEEMTEFEKEQENKVTPFKPREP